MSARGSVQVKIISTSSSKVAVRAELEVNGVRVLVAFHHDLVRENGWEPYDQPSAAAYLPLGRGQLHVIEGGGGALLVSAEAVKTS